MKIKGKYILAIILMLFGLLTVFLTSSVIFDWFGIRAKEGNYVLFVVWANFIAGILYWVTAIGIFRNKTWIVKSLLLGLVVLIIGQILFFVHVIGGGLYETKTVGAMIFRIAMTILFAVFASMINRPDLKAKN